MHKAVQRHLSTPVALELSLRYTKDDLHNPSRIERRLLCTVIQSQNRSQMPNQTDRLKEPLVKAEEKESNGYRADRIACPRL